MLELYHTVCQECSKMITRRYSTSFSMGIRLFDESFRFPIYNIYGFVRFADEIVDTFHQFDKAELLSRFRKDTYQALEDGVSLNPVLHSFQLVANKYGIGRDLIDPFLDSMEMDLHFSHYHDDLYNTYIHGSAEVVGLMCLKVFVEGDMKKYQELEPTARALGSAFQKINFLRDIASDYEERGRVYFPGVTYHEFNNVTKQKIELDIKADFDFAYQGIKMLPTGARLGVYLAYTYYLNLFKKISNLPVDRLKAERIRVSNGYKLYLLGNSVLRHQLNIL